MSQRINPLEGLAERLARQEMPTGMIIMDEQDATLCSACYRVKSGKVIEYRIWNGVSWETLPVPSLVYCQCDEAEDLAHIVTLDEAAFLRLMEEARK